MVPLQDSYMQSRVEALHNVESTIHELGNIFQQLATMVSQQGSFIDGSLFPKCATRANNIADSSSKIGSRGPSEEELWEEDSENWEEDGNDNSDFCIIFCLTKHGNGLKARGPIYEVKGQRWKHSGQAVSVHVLSQQNSTDLSLLLGK
ncbi:hypothetical protein L1887_05202 [Cichorium endivia]|nr:hypothetical protein L1887_05202 [Cichorium endivia]